MKTVEEAIGHPTETLAVEAVWKAIYDYEVPNWPNVEAALVDLYETAGEPFDSPTAQRLLAEAIDSGEVTLDSTDDGDVVFSLPYMVALAVTRRYWYWKAQQAPAQELGAVGDNLIRAAANFIFHEDHVPPSEDDIALLLVDWGWSWEDATHLVYDGILHGALWHVSALGPFPEARYLATDVR